MLPDPLGSDLLDEGFMRLAGRHGHGARVGNQLFSANALTELLPLLVVHHPHHDVAVGTGKTIDRRYRGMAVAVALPYLSAGRGLHDPPFGNRQHTVHHGDVDPLSLTGTL